MGLFIFLGVYVLFIWGIYVLFVWGVYLLFMVDGFILHLLYFYIWTTSGSAFLNTASKASIVSREHWLKALRFSV